MMSDDEMLDRWNTFIERWIPRVHRATNGVLLLTGVVIVTGAVFAIDKGVLFPILPLYVALIVACVLIAWSGYRTMRQRSQRSL